MYTIISIGYVRLSGYAICGHIDLWWHLSGNPCPFKLKRICLATPLRKRCHSIFFCEVEVQSTEHQQEVNMENETLTNENTVQSTELKPVYYDGTKLLSMLDINGKKPELLICTTNRTGGKTTYWNRYCVRRFLNHNEKFCLLYRYQYELDDVETKFFKDIKNLFFKGYEMTSKKIAKGTIRELFLNDESCGYAIALNGADAIKKYSHFLSDVARILFDEFQPETNKYVPNEIKKFFSIHTSIARGQGEQVRFVPVIMISNAVTLINPYYICLGISARLNNETKFLKGDGFVLEQGYIESASRAQKQSGFNRAFASDSYAAYSSENCYLNDNYSFVEDASTFTSIPRYICTIKYKGVEYGVKEYRNDGILYCDTKPDLTYPHKIAVTTDDHNINYIMLKHNDFTLANFRYFYNHGAWRFKDLMCKEAIMVAISCAK